MTQELKDKLLKYLCMALPYGLKCQFEDTIRVTDGESSPYYDYELSTRHLDLFMNHKNFYIKPYLRPMLSMTEEEIIEFNNIPSTKNYTIIENDLPWDVAHYKQIDWLLSHRFDFMKLIPMGNAIDCTKLDIYKD